LDYFLEGAANLWSSTAAAALRALQRFWKG